MVGKVIYTNNVLQKFKEQNVSRDTIYNTMSFYDKTYAGNGPGVTVFQKNTSIGQVSVLAKRVQHGDWLVISYWIKGNGQHHNAPRYSKDSFWKRVLNDLKSLVGLK